VDGIKIACDFISVQNLGATQELVTQFRQHRLDVGWGDDVLSFYATLYSAFVSLSALEPMAQSLDLILNNHRASPSFPSPSGAPRKKKKRPEDAHKPDCKFICPLCSQTNHFNRNGLLQHL